MILVIAATVAAGSFLYKRPRIIVWLLVVSLLGCQLMLKHEIAHTKRKLLEREIKCLNMEITDGGLICLDSLEVK